MTDYAGLKSPDVPGLQQPSAPTSSSSSSTALVLRCVALLGVGGFIFGNLATWAPLFEIHLVNTIMEWYNGYPDVDAVSAAGHHSHIIDTGPGRNITISGHTEFIRPTFLLIFCIAPFFLSVLAVEGMRHASSSSVAEAQAKTTHPRRFVGDLLFGTARYLRRKPSYPFALGVSRFTLGEWLFGIVFVCGSNALAFFFEWDRRIPAARDAGILTTTKYYNIIGISCAYLCICNMAFLLLPVTRNSVWMELFNVSYANGAKLHRWLGYATVITGVIHMLGYWVKWVRDGTWQFNQLPCVHCDLADESSGYFGWFNTFGFISVLALVLIIPMSLPFMRRRSYEWFYVSHWTLFVIAVLFAILHWGQILWWLLPSAMLFFVSRAVSSWNAWAPVLVRELSVTAPSASASDSTTSMADRLIKIVVARQVQASYDYKVGNFVYLNVPAISKLQWHALTIASSPQTSATDLTLLVKPLGDWSTDLAKLAMDATQMPVMYLDGFYGASLEMYKQYDTLCLVGGGIGATPLMAILEDVAATVAGPQHGQWTQRVVLVLSTRELPLLAELAPVLTRLRELDPTGEHFATRLYVTSTPSEEALQQPLAALTHTLTTDGSSSSEKMNKGVSSFLVAPRAFYEPLRSSTALRVTLFTVLFLVAIAVLVGVRWGNGVIQGDTHTYLWPLQRAFELFALTATILVVYVFIWWEARSGTMTTSSSAGVSAVPLTPEMAGTTTSKAMTRMSLPDVHSMQDLLSQLEVVVGQRPDMQAALKETLSLRARDDGVVGVMVSGPEALKDAANAAVVALGRRHFDVHEEEFEL